MTYEEAKVLAGRLSGDVRDRMSKAFRDLKCQTTAWLECRWGCATTEETQILSVFGDGADRIPEGAGLHIYFPNHSLSYTGFSIKGTANVTVEGKVVGAPLEVFVVADQGAVVVYVPAVNGPSPGVAAAAKVDPGDGLVSLACARINKAFDNVGKTVAEVLRTALLDPGEGWVEDALHGKKGDLWGPAVADYFTVINTKDVAKGGSVTFRRRGYPDDAIPCLQGLLRAHLEREKKTEEVLGGAETVTAGNLMRVLLFLTGRKHERPVFLSQAHQIVLTILCAVSPATCLEAVALLLSLRSIEVSKGSCLEPRGTRTFDGDIPWLPAREFMVKLAMLGDMAHPLDTVVTMNRFSVMNEPVYENASRDFGHDHYVIGGSKVAAHVEKTLAVTVSSAGSVTKRARMEKSS